MKPAFDPDAAVTAQLIAAGMLSEDQRRIALKEQARQGRPLGRILVEQGLVSEAAWQQALAHRLGARRVDLRHSLIDAAALALVSHPLARRQRILPLNFSAEDARLVVASADPDDLAGLDRLRDYLPAGVTLEIVVAGEADIEQAIDRHYGYTLSIDGILDELETGDIDRPSLAGKEYSQPTVRLIDAILVDAVKQGASDIHFEPEEGFLRIRYRIDGILRQIRALHRSYWPAMAVRLKVMAAMNIAESRAPQDGRISLTVSGRPIDFRAASQPTIHGENLVLRILDRQKGIVPLSELGLNSGQSGEIQRLIARPEGMLLVTGPTGCGKTTTLYSLLNHLNRESVHIMTLEDPVEYPMAMIRQTSVAEAANLDFANGIRSMMRQDPDIILVGEIRDAETAAMAFSAAMTGHQVFSTLHSNSAIGAIPRLLDLGVLPDLIAGNLIGIVGQRLLRRLCPHCKGVHRLADEERELFVRAGLEAPPELFLAHPEGCDHCQRSGHRGRLAILEVLRITEDLDELIARRAPAREILRQATAEGYISLAVHGLQRVAQGESSLAELARMVDLSRWQ